MEEEAMKEEVSLSMEAPGNSLSSTSLHLKQNTSPEQDIDIKFEEVVMEEKAVKEEDPLSMEAPVNSLSSTSLHLKHNTSPEQDIDMKIEDEVDSDADNEADDHAVAPSGGEQQQQPAKRRRKSTNIILPEETERMLGEWLEFEVPYIYDKGDPRHKQKEHIEHVWVEKAANLDPPIATEDLKTWFSSLRSRFGRLSKQKSGDGARRMTEREKWIVTMFSFLKAHIVRQRKPWTLGMRQSAAQAAVPEPAPVPDPAPAPDTDDGDDPSAGSQEDTTPAISRPARRVKKGKPPGAFPGATAHGTLEKLIETAEKVRHNLGGVMDVVEEPEMKYWRASLDVMAKDCVGLPASFNTAVKMELMAAIHRFRNAHEEGVTKPGPDLMLHAYRNFGFPAPQTQPQAQQQQHPPATTVAGVQGQPVLYQGTLASTLPHPLPTQPRPAGGFVLPAHQVAALQTLLRPAAAATPPHTFLPPGASTPTHSLSQLDLSQFASSSFCVDLMAAAGQSPAGTPAHSIDPGEQSLETPTKER